MNELNLPRFVALSPDSFAGRFLPFDHRQKSILNGREPDEIESAAFCGRKRKNPTLWGGVFACCWGA
ncbi:hypothetical protein HHL24_33535 [Paraburkholderia sp. RP-4-7]|uniref:Uncharacterized protein n=1 Tax=Paraburkholderia polaris TaxID=2728848 RepID=A0A848IKF7_9BURK|nr:hypothetical protein [Paraburkholderia polaris]NMM02828.1 hypothetical protein [Paraburkholderia polaris]